MPVRAAAKCDRAFQCRDRPRQGLSRLLHGKLEVSRDYHFLAVGRTETQFNLCLDFSLVYEFWIVNESSTFAVGGLLSGRGKLQRFDDSGLAGSIVTDNEGKWGVKGNDFGVDRTERSYTREQSVEGNILGYGP